MAKANSLVTLIDRKLDVTHFREQHWEGTFWEYLDLVQENPGVSRNAFQRVYDMVLSYGSESFPPARYSTTRLRECAPCARARSQRNSGAAKVTVNAATPPLTNCRRVTLM